MVAMMYLPSISMGDMHVPINPQPERKLCHAIADLLEKDYFEIPIRRLIPKPRPAEKDFFSTAIYVETPPIR
jgi:hypothetical protein